MASVASSCALRIRDSSSPWKLRAPDAHTSKPRASLTFQRKAGLFFKGTARGSRLEKNAFANEKFVMSAIPKPAESSLKTPEEAEIARVLVVGATGGVGQLCVAGLLERGISVDALVRNASRAESLFGKQEEDSIKFIVGDTRNAETLSAFKNEKFSHVIIATGTTAFPSKRWEGGNNPEQIDFIGTRNLLSALPSSVKHIVFVSSVGVTRYNQFPFSILNLFGVLKYKKMAEELVASSSIPYTIIRPGRLTDGPYTSYDLNTLLKATSGLRRDVSVKLGDVLNGEASRLVVAEACIQALSSKDALQKEFCISSVEGNGPGKDADAWKAIFLNAS